METLDQKALENAMDKFRKLVYNYDMIDTYLSVGTTINVIAERDGFDIIINENNVFHVGMWEIDQMRTYAYCSVCILREIWLGSIIVTK